MTKEPGQNGAASPSETLAEKCRQALALHQQGRMGEAEHIYREILQAQPHHFHALHMLGIAAGQRGDPQTAVELLSQAIAVNPHQAAIHADRGIALHSLGRFEEALASFDQAITLQPDYTVALMCRGVVLQALECTEEALASYDRALALSPNYTEALHGHGGALQKLGRFEQALASYDRILAVQPDHTEALIGRGTALHSLGRWEEALASYDRALILRPNYVEPLYLRGRTLRTLRRFEAALASFDHALAIDPGCAAAHWQKSLTSLLLGDFARGWEDYEWRFQLPAQRQPVRSYTKPRWRGGQELAGKTVFLYAEQGLGDTIQFCRYGRLLAARGARVVLEVQPVLKTLLAQLAGVDTLITTGEVPPEFDFHCPLLSLPLAFRTDLGSIPAEKHYVVADAERVRVWRDRLGAGTGMRIGLVWAGNPKVTHDRTRSIPLEMLTRLAMPGMEIISLQKELRSGDRGLLEAHPEIRHLGDELTDFADTAAVISNLDLVISVDAVVAHLAGALGHPVWILQSFTPDFRWLMDRDDSPWYPSARLFRQTRFADWDSVIGQVEQALRQIV